VNQCREGRKLAGTGYRKGIFFEQAINLRRDLAKQTQ